MRVSRILLLLLLVVSCVTAVARPKETYQTLKLQHDKLPLKKISSLWRFQAGDNPAWAASDFNDSSWVTRPSLLLTPPPENQRAPGNVAWFRIRLSVDSALVKQSLGFTLVHDSRAEFYLDGKKVGTSSNIIRGESEHNEAKPFKLPVVLTLPDTAEHQLAIRFSYTDGQDVSEEDRHSFSFTASVDTASEAMKAQNLMTMRITAITIFFFSFFFAFAIIHLVLFLFNRAILTNLWFSVFCFGLGLLFLSTFLAAMTNMRVAERLLQNFGTPIIAISCAAISAFVNDLFARGRFRFRIAQVTLAAGLLISFIPSLEDYILPFLIAAVCIELIVLVVRALYRRLPGARIIGLGILFFAISVMMLFGLIYAGADFATSVSERLGIVLVINVVLAILSIPLSMSVYLAWTFASVNKKLNRQLVEVERLSEAALQHEVEKQELMQHRQEELEQLVNVRTEELRGQKEKSEELLRNILPAEVAEELKEKGSAAARMYQNVSVLFTDFADFTQMAEKLSPEQLVAVLNDCFSAFDEIVTRHGLEKIKTVGDAYIAVSGLPVENDRHAQSVVLAALEIRACMQERRQQGLPTFSIRIGIHSGPVVAGIVGVKKFAYDIWGDTVNTAARMEQHSESDRINISAATYALISNEFSCSYRGELEAKHKGRMGMYFVDGPVQDVLELAITDKQVIGFIES